MPEERAADVVKRTRFERFTHRTIATPEALRTEMEKTRRRGYAVDDEELEEGLRCIAVPLLDAQTASGWHEHLRAFIPRDAAACDRQSTAAMRARHRLGHGIHIDGSRQPDSLVGKKRSQVR